MIGSTRFLLSATATAAGLLLSFAALAAPPAQVERANGRAMTAPSNAAAHDVVRGYLSNHGRSGATVSSLRHQGNAAGAHGVTHVRMDQVVDGLVVHGSYVKAAVNARGELLQVISRVSEVSAVAPSRIDAAAALRVAVASVHPNAPSSTFTPAGNSGNTSSFKGDAFFHGNANVTAVAVPQANGGLAKGWLVETWEEKSNQLYHTVVDGAGKVVEVENRTASDSYNVYTTDPGKVAQTVVNGPAPGGASPNGWLASGSQSTANIVGNNVNAYLDADNNNRADTKVGTTVTSGNFLAAADLNAAPSTAGNKNVSVQNLFYLNNRVHDILYGYGFNEANGNFQTNNFGKGGLGADAVAAEAQDGGGTDNANFATPTDGKPPRMQMYLWSGVGPTHEVKINTPVNTTYGAKGAEFGPALSTTGITGAIVRSTPADGCTAISGVSGKVALIDRGTCDFVTKVGNAQSAGATAVIVANNQGGTDTFVMGGTTRLRIPAVMISQNDGAALKAITAPNGTVRLKAQQPLMLDGSLDSDIVYHEYGHGLTWRMIGSMSGPIAGAIGEGASDGVAMLINGQPVMGVYAASSPNGIRRYRYDNYLLTYADVNGAEVHNDGEIYAAIVWKMIDLFGTARRADLFRYYVDGMNYTQATPSFENMRDGILASVKASGNTSDCALVWQAFAQYGVGVGSKAVINSSTSVTTTPSFTTSSSCN